MEDNFKQEKRDKKKQERREQGRRFREILSVLREHNIMRGLSPEKLRSILEDLGPTFIKLGQILSLHSDILPKDYCIELEKLRTDAAPMEFSEIVKILENMYDCPVEEVFFRALSDRLPSRRFIRRGC